MSNATITFSVDEELKARFSEAAKADERNDAQILRDFMRDYVSKREEEEDHDAWFRAEVERSLRQADDPNHRPIPHDEVMEKMKTLLDKRLAEASGREG